MASLTPPPFTLCTSHVPMFQSWSRIFNDTIMDSFIKSKVLILDSQPSRIWSSPHLNLSHVKSSTWKMLSKVIASKCSVTWNMCKLQWGVLWTLIHRKYLTPSHLSQANFPLLLRKPFCSHQVWYPLEAFSVHVHVWCQTLASSEFHHYLELSPPSFCYLSIFLAQISHAVLCEKFEELTNHPSLGSLLDKSVLYLDPIPYSWHLITLQ